MKTNDEIKDILERHQHWLNEDVDDWENMRAILRGADLRGANLYGADLRDANLYDANLRDANLYDANLRDANLRGANLYGANLRGANLYGANLYGANLYGANLRGANLYDANLCGAKNVSIPIACPDTGDFIGWKKCQCDAIVKLKIPDDAQRLSATGRKCRCDKAVVLEIQNLDGTLYDGTIVASNRDSDFLYEIGKTVEVNDFDTDRWKECSTGIHFFITRQEAVNYVP